MRDQLLTNNLTGSFEVTVLEVAQYTKGLNIFIIGMASILSPILPFFGQYGIYGQQEWDFW